MRRLTLPFLLGLVGTPLLSQTPPAACDAVNRPLTVGQWAEYEVRSAQMSAPFKVRLAVVGTEDVGGTKHFWHEMKMASPEGDMIMQLLVPGFPYDQSSIAGMIMKAGNQPAMRMPPNMMGMAQRAGGATGIATMAADECAKATVVGTETITVPAGQIRTTHLRSNGSFQGDAWVSETIPFGLVKLTSNTNDAMTLVGHGRDAKSSITETPMKMPGMP